MEKVLYESGNYFSCLEYIYRFLGDGYEVERMKALCWLGLSRTHEEGKRVYLLLARDILEVLLKSDDLENKIFASSKLILVLWKLGDIDSLDKLYDMIKSSEICESSEVNYSRGILALWQGGNQRAIDLSRRIESEMKAEACELRGDAYTNQGYPSDARVEYINAIRYYRCRYYDIERVQKKLLKGEACSD